MTASVGIVFVRILPVLLATAAAIFYTSHTEGPNAYAARNAAPMICVVLLSAITVYRGGGHWTANGWQWMLGTLGFAIPAIGLSLYLHFGYSVDFHGMVSESVYPREVFRFLPAYTIVAGGIGFAIGWIVGRNI